MFVFDNSSDLDLSTYQYELYEDTEIQNPNTAPYSLVSSPDKYRFGDSNASTFAIPVSGSYMENDVEVPKSYFGRVRAIDTSGNQGSWTALAKTSTSTPLIDDQYVVSLTAARIKAGEIEAAEIVLGGADPSETIIKSLTYDTSSGAQGWFISGDGHFTFGGPDGITYDNETIVIGSNVQVTANLAADSISVPTSGTPKLNINSGINGGVGGMTLGDPTYNYWYANGNFSVGSSTAYVRWNGTSLDVRGAITATSGTFTGTISGSTIVGNNISTGDIYIRETAGGNFFLTYMLGDYLQVKRTQANYSTITGTGAFLGYYDTGGGADTPYVIVNSLSPWPAAGGNYAYMRHDGIIYATNYMQAPTFYGALSGNASTASVANVANYVANDSYNARFHWSGQSGQPTWLWGSNNGTDYYVWNPSEFNVSSATTATNQSGGTVNATSVILAASQGYRSAGNFATTTSTTITARVVDGGGFQVIRAQGSMRSLKDDIQPITNAVEKLSHLRPVSFVEKPEGWEDELGLQLKSLDRHFGLIAEEVAEDFPELAAFGYPGGYPMKTDENGKEIVDQEELIKFEKYVPISWREMGAIPLLIKAVQELSTKIDELENRV